MHLLIFHRRIVLLTKERGRISAFARGARRPKSTLVAATNPFVSGGFWLYEGRDSYTLAGADVEEYYEKLTSDLELVWYGYYFLEMAEYFSVENNDETKRVALLREAFTALMQGRLPIPLTRAIYEFKTLVLNGDVPNAFYCAGCGKREKLCFFSMEKRSVVCGDCHNVIQSTPIQQAVLKAMQYITITPEKELFSFLLSEDAFGMLQQIIREYFRRYVGHIFKSEAFLDL